MFPRQPSHPPITEPTIWLSIVATRSKAPGSRIKRVSPSIESLILGGVTPAACHSRSTASSSSVRTGLITTVTMEQPQDNSPRPAFKLCRLFDLSRQNLPQFDSQRKTSPSCIAGLGRFQS